MFGVIGLSPAHGVTYSVLIPGNIFSLHAIKGFILLCIMSVLYPFSSAVPATLNLSDPNLAVTIFASSSNMLVHGATSGLRIVILYPFTGYIGRSSPIVLARALLSTPAQIITGMPKSMFLISL